MEQIRLQKFFTDCGVLSRRAAEEEIRLGKVKVNGRIANIGHKIDPESDVVEYEGRIIRPTITPKHYILLYKPRGIVTTLSDEKGRTTVADLVADVGVRVYPVGRLDMDSDGLLILTNDGDFSNHLMHPRHEIKKVYRVIVSDYCEAAATRLKEPIVLDGYRIKPPEVKLLSSEGQKAVFLITIHEGRNRQVRRMCAAAGMQVRRLTRVAEGSLQLGNLPAGKWRYLTDAEVAELKK